MGVRILTQEMERICTDTLHLLFYDYLSKKLSLSVSFF